MTILMMFTQSSHQWNVEEKKIIEWMWMLLLFSFSYLLYSFFFIIIIILDSPTHNIVWAELRVEEFRLAKCSRKYTKFSFFNVCVWIHIFFSMKWNLISFLDVFVGRNESKLCSRFFHFSFILFCFFPSSSSFVFFLCVVWREFRSEKTMRKRTRRWNIERKRKKYRKIGSGSWVIHSIEKCVFFLVVFLCESV